MFSVFSLARGTAAKLALVVSALWLAACDPVGPTASNEGPRVDRNAPVPVALLVPAGSGQANDQLLARSLENAARLAIADLDGVRIDLRVYNTAGQPERAAAMAQQAVNEGAQIILGPVFGGEANAVGNAVAAQNINVLSFSNNADIAGGNVFVLGPTFQNTAERLVRFAARQGKGRILVVHERNTAGEAGRRAIEQAIAGSSANLVGSEGFEFSQNGVIQAMPRISAAARQADAVFLTADTAGALPLLTQLMPENGIDRNVTQYIGLTRWDIPQATLALPGVQGGWFALPDPGLNQQFQARFTAAYGEAPHSIAGLAYDGIAAIGAAVRSGNPNALSRAGLTQSSGFAGVNGVFRLRPDGTNERGLAVAQIRNNEVVIVDPAPRSFTGAGF
ncbi:penicillin-binding protein activator [Plastorhodobacter daqingensis]|uniref:Penicillin-binding protein activator n=1 Tax=Plastorhodobacter daqingensis TaxID=1387281 RepID=A0ABW2UGU4_9RHOB